MFPTLVPPAALLADAAVLATFGALLFSVVFLCAAGGGWEASAARARDARGGPVKPATTRDYVMVTIYMTLAGGVMLYGPYHMKR